MPRFSGAVETNTNEVKPPLMPLITISETPSGLTEAVDTLERQLADMRKELSAMYDRVQLGEFGELKNASRIIADIRQWLKIAIEAEAQLANREKQELGISLSYGLDLDRAKETIGCELDRLRRARDTGGVSRQSE
ncbi:hypothetical protein [Roseovarius rhodophyticola]|uniref:Uncharacterized protein n=1 Tax=Roseovarius rhodophyticola TaxID=3080827 RepID=A0ABZ2TFC7_9RHOB|nr:hypothetical protein [Roseovarius sp. W115]